MLMITMIIDHHHCQAPRPLVLPPGRHPPPSPHHEHNRYVLTMIMMLIIIIIIIILLIIIIIKKTLHSMVSIVYQPWRLEISRVEPRPRPITSNTVANNAIARLQNF